MTIRHRYCQDGTQQAGKEVVTGPEEIVTGPEEIVTGPEEIVTARGTRRVGNGSGRECCVAQSVRQQLLNGPQRDVKNWRPAWVGVQFFMRFKKFGSVSLS